MPQPKQSEQRTRPQVDAQRFPALRKLLRRDRSKIKHIQQTQAADCGAASLTMVLHYHGSATPLKEVRDVMGIGLGGSSAAQISRASEHYGLRPRGLTLDVDAFDYLPPASILHWEFNHFVVYEGRDKDGFRIVDPALGPRFISRARMRKSFTGVALTFEKTDSFEPVAAGKSRVWWYFRQLLEQKHIVWRALLLAFVLQLFALATPLLTAVVVDRVIPRDDYNLLLVAVVGLGVMLFFSLLITFIRAYTVLHLRTNLDLKMILGFVGHLARLPYGFFQKYSAGDLMMRVHSNTQIRDLIAGGTLAAIMDGTMAVGYLFLIIAISPTLGGIVIAVAAAQIVIFMAGRRRYRELIAEQLESTAKSQSYLVEFLAGMETLKSAGAELMGVEKWSNLYVDQVNVTLSIGRFQALLEAIMGLVKNAGPLIILSWGATAVMGGDLSLGVMLALAALSQGFLVPINNLMGGAVKIELLGGYINRIDDVFATRPEQDGVDLETAPALKGGIEFENVSFRYTRAGAKTIDDVSLKIEPGTTVALVGRSGSGKSTLAKMLAGLYLPDEGRILYDNHDMSRIELSSLRRQLGVVPQHPYLFGSSVRANVAVADPSLSFRDVVRAAEIACIHDDIEDMPMAYESLLADGGASLAGGQRQRIALARAVIRRPAILILDEATSALDAETERKVVLNLEKLRCTRVIVAHRLSTIQKADKIVVMRAGKIVEVGTHFELLARNGVYAGLVAAQREADEDTATREVPL